MITTPQFSPMGVSAPRLLVEHLTVAGGGGGGRSRGGGGGGGGLLTGFLSVPLNAPLSIVVGAGGSATTLNSARGGKGGDSKFAFLTSIGGGGGG